VRRFLFVRASHAAVVIALVATLAFVLVHTAPGDPFSTGLEDPSFTPALHAQQLHHWGYDQPLAVQYVKWIANIARLEFGWSHSRGRSVAAVLADTVPRTLLLMLTAIAAGVTLGAALGTWQAVRRGSRAEKISGAFALALLSVPEFLLALAALAIPAARWHWFPVSGVVDPALHDSMSFVGRAADVARHLVLPAATLALVIAASVSRYQRTAMLSVLPEEFIRTARAKGAGPSRVVWRHAFRNALGPLATIVGLLLPLLFGGAVFVETIFNWPGIGRTMVEAVAGNDYPLVLAGVVIGSALVVIGSGAADLIAAWADPRIMIDA
jgi:peptide/nickel transport system permease protein